MFYSICCSWEEIILYLCIVVKNDIKTTCELINVLHFLCYILIMNPFMTGHRALEKKQITQGNNRKVQNPSGSPKRKESYGSNSLSFLYMLNSCCSRSVSFHCFQGCFVIRLVCHFVYQFCIHHFPFRIDDDYGSCQ